MYKDLENFIKIGNTINNIITDVGPRPNYLILYKNNRKNIYEKFNNIIEKSLNDGKKINMPKRFGIKKVYIDKKTKKIKDSNTNPTEIYNGYIVYNIPTEDTIQKAIKSSPDLPYKTTNYLKKNNTIREYILKILEDRINKYNKDIKNSAILPVSNHGTKKYTDHDIINDYIYG